MRLAFLKLGVFYCQKCTAGKIAHFWQSANDSPSGETRMRFRSVLPRRNRHVFLPCQDLPNGPDKLVRRGILAKITGSAGLQGPDNIILAGV